MKEVTVTLNRAHKLVGRMNLALSELLQEARGASAPMTISEHNCDRQIESKNKNLKEITVNYLTLQDDIRRAREEIGKVNQIVGINNILSKKAEIVSVIGLWNVIKQNILSGMSSGYNDILSAQEKVRDHVTSLREKASGFGSPLSIKVPSVEVGGEFDPVKIKNMIDSLNRQLYEADDQLSNLNATKIPLLLTDYTYSLLYSDSVTSPSTGNS